MPHPRRRWTVTLATVLAGALLAGAAPVAAATPAPSGSWALKGNLANSAGTSLRLTKLGTPTFKIVDVAGKTRKALVFEETEGLRLSGIPRSARKTFTIDVRFEFDETDDYERILSFGPSNVDEGLYLYNGYPYLYSEKGNKSIVIDPDQWVRVRVTRNGPTKVMKVYVDGVRAFSFKDADNAFLLRRGIIDFFNDDPIGGTGEDSAGTVAQVRFWNKVVAP